MNEKKELFTVLKGTVTKTIFKRPRNGKFRTKVEE